jgi:hypothetical protein
MFLEAQLFNMFVLLGKGRSMRVDLFVKVFHLIVALVRSLLGQVIIMLPFEELVLLDEVFVSHLEIIETLLQRIELLTSVVVVLILLTQGLVLHGELLVNTLQVALHEAVIILMLLEDVSFLVLVFSLQLPYLVFMVSQSHLGLCELPSSLPVSLADRFDQCIFMVQLLP